MKLIRIGKAAPMIQANYNERRVLARGLRRLMEMEKRQNRKDQLARQIETLERR